MPSLHESGVDVGENQYRGVLATIFIFALVIRIGLAATFAGLNEPPDGGAQPDQIEYEQLAWSPLVGDGYSWDGLPTARRMPGTSMTIMPVYVVLGRNFAAARVWFCVLSAATCLAAVALTAQLTNRRIGLVAGFLLAIYPNHAYYSMHFVSEVPYALAITLATTATLRSFRKEAGVGAVIVTGLLWAATALIRPNVLAILVALPLLAVVKPGRRIELLRKSAIVLTVCAMTLLPWVLRNRAQIGSGMLSSVGSYTFWGAHNEKVLLEKPGSWIRTQDLIDDQHPFAGTELELNRLAWKYGTDFVRAHASDMPRLTVMKLYRMLTPLHETPNRLVKYVFALAWCVVGPLALIGLVYEARRDWWRTQISSMAIWTTLITTVLFYGSIRFRDAIAPVYVGFAAIGFVWAADWVWNRRHRSNASVLTEHSQDT